MRILINTVCFYPNIGGLETINMILAKELSRIGQDVTVLAPDYPSMEYDDSSLPFRIIRGASRSILLKEYMRCDVFLHSPLSVKAIWPIVLWPFKKWFCVYHMCEFHTGTTKNMQAKLKYLVSRFPRNIAVSNAVKEHLKLPNCTVIHNAYDNTLFKDNNKNDRKGFSFVGRLVSVKGIFVLLDAFTEFVKRNPTSIHNVLYIIGDGEERSRIVDYIQKRGIEENVVLHGMLTGKELVDEMNDCYCQVVPSVYNEAFGIVALEAMATGCIPLVSDGDGLQEAVGDSVFTFRKSDSNHLLMRMEYFANLTTDEVHNIRKSMKAWCSHFTPEVVASNYLNCFTS